MKLSDFNYNLPSDLIAKYPLEKRSASRLLCLNARTGTMNHHHFGHLVSLLKPKDLLICNNTRVMTARLFGQKESGGKVEMLVERILDAHRILAHVRASKSPKPLSYLIFNNINFKVLKRHDDLFELECINNLPVIHIIEKYGDIPLPHYFNRSPEKSDLERYQTIYAKHKGSVAAPTAGLHFDEDIFQQLKIKNIEIGYITLHVGAGTFSPVKVDDITTHQMHSESVHVSELVCEQIKRTKASGGRVIAVGTTTARSLETASLSGSIQPFSGDTNIFIYPGFKFKCIDGLITNFHLPGSTLLMLVAALAGHDNIKAAYEAAIQERYRFFSYGDAMFIIANEMHVT